VDTTDGFAARNRAGEAECSRSLFNLVTLF
jgi:hypothetical protein